MVTTLHSAVVRTMRALDDESGEVWSYDRIAAYIQDGYDQMCRRMKCLFDMHVIENVPVVGNWGSDLELYLGLSKPGMGLTDEPLHFTSESERGLGVGGRPGASMTGPTPGTSPLDGEKYDQFGAPTKVATGRLPDSLVEVLRVTWDEYELLPEDSSTLRSRDNQYERREGGDPKWFTIDKDGMNVLRLVPPARGDAVYPVVHGSFGRLAQIQMPVDDVVFWDDFSGPYSGGGASEPLVDRIPHPVGQGWAQGPQVADDVVIRASSNEAAANIDSLSGEYLILFAVPYPSGADVTIEVAQISASSAAIRPFGLIARFQDINNYYALVCYGTDNPNFRIIKKVSGVYTTLASVNIVMDEEAATKFVVSGSTLEGYRNGVLLCSATDSSLSSAGACALGMGDLFQSGGLDRISTEWTFSDFRVYGSPFSTVRDIAIGSSGFTDYLPEVHGSRGILREVEGAFPANGPYGTVVRMHPTEANTVVEMVRLGKELRRHHFEVPRSWVKFCRFWAMHLALKDSGPGQDLKLAKHYFDRFEMGISRGATRLKKVQKEYVAKMGTGEGRQEPFDLGPPQLPYPYGPGRRLS